MIHDIANTVCAPLRFCCVCGPQPCTTCHTLTFPLFFRTDVRDSQMFTIPTPPASHVSRNRMSRNFQKGTHRLPEKAARRDSRATHWTYQASGNPHGRSSSAAKGDPKLSPDPSRYRHLHSFCSGNQTNHFSVNLSARIVMHDHIALNFFLNSIRESIP